MPILPLLVVLAAAVPGLMPQTTTSEDIPVLHLNLLKAFKSGFSIHWDPIETNNRSAPIIGIKVKVWKTPCVNKTVTRITEVTKLTRVVEQVPETYNSTTIPNELPEYVAIVTKDELSATITNTVPEQWYHIRALAFTSSAEGKLSDSYDFKTSSMDVEDLKRSCEKIISETPIKSIFD